MNKCNEKWLPIVRQLVSGDPSRARVVWQSLRSEHKSIILMSARLSPRLTSAAWDDFDLPQLRAIHHGIKKLKILVNMFSACRENDYRPSTPRPLATRCDGVNALNAKAQLLSQTKH